MTRSNLPGPTSPGRTIPRLAATLTLTAGLFAGAVGPSLTVGASPGVATQQTYAPGDGWMEVAPDAQGMDPASLEAARDYAFQPDRHTQGVVITRGGEIVTEWYADGEGPRSWGASWSVAKSFTSALVGIAIEEGLIEGVDVSMAEYFPEWRGTAKADITLLDVLHMESGLKWNEDYDPDNMAASDIIQMGISRDQLAYAASRPVEVAPGTRFNYSSGDTMLLSHVIQTATGMPADEYARRKLFEPIGMDQVEWWRDGAGHTLTYCCLDTTSRNYARMGLLYLRGGEWNGRQVVPKSWVDASLTGTDNSDGRYGLQWWIRESDLVDGPIYMMNGFDGQFTFIIPSLDMVIVRNGDYVKSECDPIADPTLFGPYPPSNLAPGRGTRPPASWDHSEFLAPIVAAATGDAGAQATPQDQADTGQRVPPGETTAPCDVPSEPTEPTVPPTTVPGPTTPQSPPAQPVMTRATYTG